MEKFFKGAREGELGIWVVISGWFDAAKACCQKVGLMFHTIEHSLDIWGKTDKLPPKDVLEINTMCGRGMGAANLVTFLASGHQSRPSGP
jgi:hypothetical protein